MKRCKRCGEVKPLSEFHQYYHNIQRKKRYRPYCKKCWNEYNKPYHIKYQRDYQRKIVGKYGIGIRTINSYGLKLALFVYDRANRKCQKCGSENDLTIHHLDRNGRNNQEKGLPMNNEPDNLIVLCRKCHGSIHGKQGGWTKGRSRTP